MMVPEMNEERSKHFLRTGAHWNIGWSQRSASCPDCGKSSAAVTALVYSQTPSTTHTWAVSWIKLTAASLPP